MYKTSQECCCTSLKAFKIVKQPQQLCWIIHGENWPSITLCLSDLEPPSSQSWLVRFDGERVKCNIRAGYLGWCAEGCSPLGCSSAVSIECSRILGHCSRCRLPVIEAWALLSELTLRNYEWEPSHPSQALPALHNLLLFARQLRHANCTQWQLDPRSSQLQGLGSRAAHQAGLASSPSALPLSDPRHSWLPISKPWGRPVPRVDSDSLPDPFAAGEAPGHLLFQSLFSLPSLDAQPPAEIVLSREGQQWME